MSGRPGLLFYCQHSVGMGHLVRSLALARALSYPFDVTLLSGGSIPPSVPLPPGVRIVPLPAVGLDADGQLVCRDRRRRLAPTIARRTAMLLEAYRQQKPRIVVVELFPFGRRKFRVELEPLLDLARRDGARVCCSVRDILVSRDDRQREHDTKAMSLLAAYFDVVLVHSDPAFARLEDSLAAGISLPVPVHHTGFVHDAAPADGHAPRTRPGSVVVSAGGGMVGAALLANAVEAERLFGDDEAVTFSIIGGPYLPQHEWRALKRAATGRRRVRLLRSVPTLAPELRHASASISQCGYNTALDIVSAGVPAIVVPYGDGAEDEQRRRADRLGSLGIVSVLPPEDATPARLADAVRAVWSRPRPAQSLDLNGASRTAAILDRLAGRSARSRRA